MSIEENAARFRRLIEAGIGQGDLAVLDEIISPACVEHQRGLHSGSEGAREVLRTLHSWFSDFELKVVDLVAEGDKVWALNRARGVNTGSIMGRPATGTRMEIDVIDIGRFEDGRLVEHWGVPDQLGMMLQLGLMPRPEPAAAQGR